MRAHVVIDSGVLIATISKQDTLHNDAVFIFEELKARKENILIIVPPLVIYEVIVTLRRKGISAKSAEEIMMRFVNLPYVTVLSLSEMSAFKHAARSLIDNSQTSALRTHDFMIFCIAEEFEATILTFDKSMRQKCRPVYQSIYFLAAIKDQADETADALTEIDQRSGVDVNAPDYNAQRTVPF